MIGRRVHDKVHDVASLVTAGRIPLDDIRCDSLGDEHQGDGAEQNEDWLPKWRTGAGECDEGTVESQHHHRECAVPKQLDDTRVVSGTGLHRHHAAQTAFA
jgi:hypothetical protein